MDESEGHVAYVARQRLEARRIAECALSGQLRPIEAARQLTSLGWLLVEDFWSDPDFSVLGALDSEADHLPVGEARQYWAPSALEMKDAEILRIENSAREEVLAACRSIRDRYGAG